MIEISERLVGKLNRLGINLLHEAIAHRAAWSERNLHSQALGAEVGRLREIEAYLFRIEAVKV